ncbi:prepilin-type N-terminal cleavage/methylation domain-containing protein [Vibrio sp. PP-XX7]
MSTSFKGFSLLEIMVALLMLSIGIVGIFQLQQLTCLQGDEVGHTYHALSLAESELERLRLNVGEINHHETESPSDSYPQYQWFWSTDRTLFSGDLKQVTIHVTWRDRRGKMHAIALSTMISNVQP